MLMLLANCGAPLDLRDCHGHTPLFYAKRQVSGVMKKALVELIGAERASQVRDKLIADLKSCVYVVCM